MTNKPTPVDHVRLGAISAAIWANPSENGPRYGITIERLYRDPTSGDWKSSSTFNRDDLLVLGKVADQAHTRVHELQSQDRAQAREDAGIADPNDPNRSPPASAAGGTRGSKPTASNDNTRAARAKPRPGKSR